MTCCRCNRNGTCRGCICAQQGTSCSDCLPKRLNRCSNLQTNHTDNREPDQDSTESIENHLSASARDDESICPPLNDVQTTHVAVDSTHTSESQPQPQNFMWGSHNGSIFRDKIEATFEEAIHWRRNIFQVPSGSTGKAFVAELARLFQAYADNSSLESIALKAATIMPTLLLQKPHPKSKVKDHIRHLQRRLDLWLDGDLQALLDEGKSIQKRLGNHSRSNDEDVGRIFRNLMLKGRVQGALRYLSKHTTGGVLKLDDLIPETTVEGETRMRFTRDVLNDKHPLGKDPDPRILLDGQPTPVNPIIFDAINADTIRNAALHTNGAAGPSGLDAYAWRRLCSSFKSASNSLCSALAGVGRRIATTSVHPDGLSAFIACRLIPLDKCPGVRPIGIGEVPRRIIAKAILRIIGVDVQEAASSLQLCAGQDSGCEAAIHAMRNIFHTPKNEAVLLVDAGNAFNSLNRKAALHNIGIICPSLAQILTNTYGNPVRLFVAGGGEIASTEGTTQGDPLAMAMYAIAITPLIDLLRESCPEVPQVWFADDATGAATCTGLRQWWNKLTEYGPSFGYHPNASKTYLVVKQEYEESAKTAFADTEVHITTQGKRHLGAALGFKSFTEEYVTEKVQKWTDDIKYLAKIASSQPHAAYAAYVHGLSNYWSFLMRTIPDIDDLLQPLEDAIHQHLIPALTGRPACSSIERDLLALPVRLGGLGLNNPSSLSPECYQSSVRITAPLAALIVSQEKSSTADHDAIMKTKKEINERNRHLQEEKSKNVYNHLTPELKRCVDLAKEKGSSSWLAVLPLEEHGFFLHKGEFRDALAIRYGWTPNNIPHSCNCGSQFTISHAMICHKGGFPTIRHNEIRDITASLLTEVCSNVATEPSLQPLSGEIMSARSTNTDDGARADVRARGFWNARQDAFFDIRVFYPNAPSYRTKDLSAIYKKHEQDKKRQYGQRIREVEHGVFTPLVFSTTGGMGREAMTFYKRLADMLTQKRHQPYSTVIGWLRCRLSFASIRASIMCIRGSRSSYHHPISAADSNISLATSEGRIPSMAA